MTNEPGEKREPIDFEVKPMARKLAYYLPLGKGSCGGCGQPIVYNMTVELVEHEEPNPDCPRAWVKVTYTPEQEAQIAASEAEAAKKRQADLDRHEWMRVNAPHPILRALVEAHGPNPHSDPRWPTCAECPPIPTDYDPEPQDWPCSVWSFISDRMEEGT